MSRHDVRDDSSGQYRPMTDAERHRADVLALLAASNDHPVLRVLGAVSRERDPLAGQTPTTAPPEPRVGAFTIH